MNERSLLIPHVFTVGQTYFGKGSASSFMKFFESKKPLILASETVSKTSYFSRIIEPLSNRDVAIETIKSPEISICNDISYKYSSTGIDSIIAIGGGKVIDSSKIIRSSLGKIQLIAIPSTPGTGSHVTSIAVIIDKNGEKIPKTNFDFMPDLAILDTNFLETMHERDLVYSSADIFSHNMEGSVSRLSNAFIKHLAIFSLNLLKEGSGSKDPKDLEKVFYAGHIGGMVQGNAYVGMCHALAHSAETYLNINHGRIILNLLQPYMKWMEEHETVNDYGYFKKVYRELNLDGFTEPNLFSDIDKNSWADKSLHDPSLKTSPIKITKEILLDVIKCAQI